MDQEVDIKRELIKIKITYNNQILLKDKIIKALLISKIQNITNNTFLVKEK